MAPAIHFHVHEETAQHTELLQALHGLSLLCGTILQGVTSIMTKAELEAALDSIKVTLAGVAGNVTDINTAVGAVATAAAGISADIASLKAMIDTGATGDLSQRVQDILNAAEALATTSGEAKARTQAQADALTALDAETTQEGEDTTPPGEEPPADPTPGTEG